MLLSGCGSKAETELDIDLELVAPVAYVGEEYDFRDVLNVEKDVEYKLEAYYYNYYEKKEKTLQIRDAFYFTPLELFDISVVVTAFKDDATASRTKLITVSQRVDPVDELLSNGGYSGWADPGITKEVVTDSMYIKGENSTSSLSVRYQGSSPYDGGATLLTLNNFRLLPYWSDQTWDNGVLHFWVFNPMKEKLVFELRIYDELTKTVNIDWGHYLMEPQYAKAADEDGGKWTEIIFSLRHLGVTHTLYADEEGTRTDSFNVKVRYEGAPKSGSDLYNFQFYIDDVDVIPYSKDRFPDLDTTCYATAETLEYGWENMILDAGWSRSIPLFDRELMNDKPEHPSLSSMLLKFNDVTPDPNHGYTVILSPEEEFGVDLLPSFRHGTLDFDVLFSDDIADREMSIIAVHKEWVLDAKMDVTPVITDNNWLHVSVDFGEHANFYNITQGIRLGFAFEGVNKNNQNTAVIHVDNIVFDQKGGIPEGDIPVARGLAFGPGFAVDLDPIALDQTMVLDFRFTSNEETVIRLMVGDGWDNYYGYYLVNYDGTLGGEYDGVSIETLQDGYFRVTLTLSELAQGQDIETIEKINLIYLQEVDDSASGYIDFISPKIY